MQRIAPGNAQQNVEQDRQPRDGREPRRQQAHGDFQSDGGQKGDQWEYGEQKTFFLVRLREEYGQPRKHRQGDEQQRQEAIPICDRPV